MTGWTVAKFGGTSMANIETMTQCTEVVRARGANIVLVSASSGTTNQLIEISSLAKAGQLDDALQLVAVIEQRHRHMLSEISNNQQAVVKLDELLHELNTLVTGCSMLKECSPKAYDAILSLGEMMSSTIFATLCDQQFQRDIHWIDVRNIIKTDSQHGKANPTIHLISECCRNKFLDRQALYITQGFIGSDRNANTTTLGRGGSDYSAALVAEGIKADELQIWTDVPGMASTDPRICRDARPISTISIKEASEMATFGAKILHPSSLMPAIRHNIPVFVGSTFDPEHSGTTITREVDNRPVIRAVTKRSNQCLVIINNPDMLTASGFLQRIFAVFDKYQVSVDAITTSEISIAVTIDHDDYPAPEIAEQFLSELQTHGTVKTETNMALIAIVGNDLHQTSGIGAQIFSALKDINVRMITQGASSHNFCLIVNDADSELAVKQLHQHLISSR